MHRRNRSLAVLSLLVVLALTPMAQGAVFAQGADPRFTATPLTPDSTISIGKGAQSLAPLIVKLKDPPLATYSGGISGLAPTNPHATGAKRLELKTPASTAYLKHLAKQQADFEAQAKAAAPNGKVTHQYDVILNAVSMVVPVDQISAIAALPNVEAVYPDEILHPDTDSSPQFIGAPTVWAALGGQESAGEGVIVGVIDTGIWPEHPSFADPDASGKAYAPPPAAPSGDARLCQFSGGSNPGPAFTCNNKLIAAYRVLSTYDAVVGPEPGYTSARDADGHGTHTSSTSAGNANVEASIFDVPRGVVSGVAPRAYVIMYKALGNGGGFSSDLAAAVQQAILDGVDVINYSISGGANAYSDPVELAFLNAYAAGVFVAASAGNSGPNPDTTDHRGPWVTTVAASTQVRAFENSATLTADGGGSLTVTGASITAGVGPAPIVVPADDPMCNSPFAAGSVSGQIVVCERGVTGRAEKGYNVLQGGAVGMILYNQAANVTDLETDNHYLPATHIQFAEGTAVLDFIAAHTNVQATLTEGQKVDGQGDVMASFSSRGGPGQTLGVSKPDITAPGVQILAGASPQHLTPAEGGVALGPEGELFQAIAGTSMSSPHIAGAGALIAALHPDWTPGQIKSALMTTAWTQVVKEDGTTPADAFDYGSGRVDLNKAGDPGITFDVTPDEYLAHAADLWNANYPSVFVPVLPGAITVRRTAHSVVSGYATHWVSSVTGAEDLSVSLPKNITVPPGQDVSFDITIDASNVPLGAVRMAVINLAEKDGNGTRQLHIPVTVIRKQAPVSLSKSCDPATVTFHRTTRCTITASNESLSDANITIADNLPLQLSLVRGSVTGGLQRGSGGVFFQGSLAGAAPPDVTIGPGTSPAGFLPLAEFGIPPISSAGDETIANFNVPAFIYGGETYTRVGVVSNGYLVVGGGSAADIQYINQELPDPVAPNNVLAPFWTDLNPAEGGTLRLGTLTDGQDSWIVAEWNAVQEFSTAANTHSFQIWIGYAADAHPGQDISMAYGPNTGNGDGGFATTGAENKFGNRGANYYYDGSGTLPVAGTELVVSSVPGVPGETHTITFDATGSKVGNWVNTAKMTGDLFQGTSTASFAGKVTR